MLDEYQFPGYRQRVDIQGVFGDPRARVIQLERVQINGLWLLWCGLAELLRQESTADIWDLSCRDARIYLEVEVRHVCCRKCGKVKRERLH